MEGDQGEGGHLYYIEGDQGRGALIEGDQVGGRSLMEGDQGEGGHSYYIEGDQGGGGHLKRVIRGEGGTYRG